jgi:hypothetical protein
LHFKQRTHAHAGFGTKSFRLDIRRSSGVVHLYTFFAVCRRGYGASRFLVEIVCSCGAFLGGTAHAVNGRETNVYAARR